MPTGCKSEYLHGCGQSLCPTPHFGRALPPYLLVISKVVPKIWARTNSAILSGSAP